MNPRATDTRLTISAVVACAANRVIGRDGTIPWRIPGEQKLFKKYTKNKVVVMGRTTWESIPKKFRPLPDRLNIMLTSNPDYSGAECIQAKSVLEALMIAEAVIDYDELVFIGGQRVYEEGLPFCTKLYLTRVEGIYPGDRFFPKINKSEWTVAKETYIPLEESGSVAYTFSELYRSESPHSII